MMALVVGKGMAIESFGKSFTDIDYKRAAESNSNSIDFGYCFDSWIFLEFGIILCGLIEKGV